jgi:hypothetical protein
MVGLKALAQSQTSNMCTSKSPQIAWKMPPPGLARAHLLVLAHDVPRGRRRRAARRATGPAVRTRTSTIERVPPDPLALLRSRSYVQLLVVAALIGVPVSAVAFGFLKLVAWLQQELFTDLPETLGFDAAPTWWPLPLLALSGVLVALSILHLPGTGGHSPADGFKTAGALRPRSCRACCSPPWRR